MYVSRRVGSETESVSSLVSCRRGIEWFETLFVSGVLLHFDDRVLADGTPRLRHV